MHTCTHAQDSTRKQAHAHPCQHAHSQPPAPVWQGATQARASTPRRGHEALRAEPEGRGAVAAAGPSGYRR
eukprot:8708711-Lingulodinium_polyedra.AAC.1